MLFQFSSIIFFPDRDCPTYVEALEHWKTVFISCGADHTAVLSKVSLKWKDGNGKVFLTL